MMRAAQKNRRFAVMMLILLMGGGVGVLYGSAWGVPGLAVNAQGQIVRDGLVYRGIGVDYFDAFEGHLMDNPGETSFVAGFKVLGDRQIPFTRVLLGGFWPIEQHQYTLNRTVFFQRMDAVVKAAEDNHVGIVADLFWCYNTVPDIVGEHIDAWDDLNSQSYVLMRQYIDDVVARYSNSPAIWGWECGNEYNLNAELPNPEDFLPATWTDLGCPATRDPVRDIITQARMAKLLSQFALEVRKIDPNRMIVSGNSIPRWAGWHIENGGTWDHDTRAQFDQMVQIENPDPLNTLGIHIYTGTEIGFFDPFPVTLSGLMAACMEVAATAHKPVFLGEFGAPANVNGQPNPSEHDQMVELISAIEDNKVPLAAVWNFNRCFDDPDWNITATNARGYQLDLIQAANDRIKNQLMQEGGYVPVELSSFEAE